MTNLAKSVYYFSFYLLLAGLALFLFPNQVLGLLTIPQTAEVWPRLAGALTFILGVFFNYMVRKNILPFFYISMFGRGIFITAIIIVVAFYKAPLPLLLFGAVDFVGLLWTLVAYKKSS